MLSRGSGSSAVSSRPDSGHSRQTQGHNSRPASSSNTDANAGSRTPRSCSRSSSFTSSTGSTPGGLGKPPQHTSGTGANRPSSRQAQQASTARRSPFDAAEAQARRMSLNDVLLPAAPAVQYGRFSLDQQHLSTQAVPYPLQPQQMLASSGMQVEACADRPTAWPASTNLCNSLSMPDMPNPAAMILDELSWTSTVTGDMYFAPAALEGGSAAVAGGQSVGGPLSANNELQQLQLQLAQQQQRQLVAQQLEQERCMLLTQLGMSAAPAGCVPAGVQLAPTDPRTSLDSRMLQVPYMAGPAEAYSTVRRASFAEYMPAPASGVCLDTRACSVPLQHLRLPPQQVLGSAAGVVGVSAAMAVGAAGGGCQEVLGDSALEAELDAALHKLLAMRQQVAQKKALSQGVASRQGMGSAAAAGAAAAPGSMPVANALASGLYQPSQPAAGGLSGTHSSVQCSLPQATVMSGMHQLNMVSGANASLSYRADAASLAAVSLATPAPSMMASCGASMHSTVHSSVGQAGLGAPTLADVVACNNIMGLSAQEALLQDQLHCLALREASFEGGSMNQSSQMSPADALGLQLLTQAAQAGTHLL